MSDITYGLAREIAREQTATRHAEAERLTRVRLFRRAGRQK